MDGVAGECELLGDAVAHQAGAEDSNVVDIGNVHDLRSLVCQLLSWPIIASSRAMNVQPYNAWHPLSAAEQKSTARQLKSVAGAFGESSQVIRAICARSLQGL